MTSAQRHVLQRFTACARARVSSESKSKLDETRELQDGTTAASASIPTEGLELSETPTIEEHGKYQSYRLRKAGNRPLPLSPFLDPARFHQRWKARHRLPKQPASRLENMDEFRRKLAADPYGESSSRLAERGSNTPSRSSCSTRPEVQSDQRSASQIISYQDAAYATPQGVAQCTSSHRAIP